MPASVSAGDLLLVALKMPPSSTGTYSNFTFVRFSIAGIASWLRKALGLPKSNRNCGFELTAVSDALPHSGARPAGRPPYYDDRNIVAMRGLPPSHEPLHRLATPDQGVVAELQDEHGAEHDRVGGPDPVQPD